MVTHRTEHEPMDQGTLPLSPWKGENPELPLNERIVNMLARELCDRIDRDILTSIQQPMGVDASNVEHSR